MSVQSRRDPLGISGTVIGDKYKVGPAVGEGGFSVVYQAEHLIWKQPVAIKCFKILANAPEDQREKLLEGFIQEGKLMATLSTRTAAIVQARDVGTFTTPDGLWLPYMVLEWLEGRPLDVILFDENRAGMPQRQLHEAMALLEPAAGALEIAHSQGIAHRDIKPANFFVIGDPRSPNAHLKVLDFGIAKVMADHAAAAAALAHTGKDITAFTPNYGAPEQFSRSHGATGPWTDVFAMALILVEIMRGCGAIDGTDLIQMAVASRDPNIRPTPRRFGIGISDLVEQVFLRALAVNPGERYGTMGQFWNALHQALYPDSPSWSPSAAGGGRASFMTNPGAMPTGGFRSTGTGMPAIQRADSQLGPSGQITPSPQSRSLLVPESSVVRPSRAPLVFSAVAAVALAAGGFGAYKMLGKPAAPNPGPVASTETSATPPASGSAAIAAAARRTTCPDGMVLVPGGPFFMGSDEPGFELWKPAHKVTIDTFCIDIYEVTAGDYKACSDAGECKRADTVPSYPKGKDESDKAHDESMKAQAEFCNFGKEDRARHPINCINWALSDAYCKYRKARLPTEAEWEYAARGSDGRKYPWGDEAGDMQHMNAAGTEYNKWQKDHNQKPVPLMFEADDGYVGTAPVGSFPKGKTKFGAYDFIGNVWEWTSDWFETYKPDEVTNPKGAPAGDRKAIRGGGFNGGAQLWLNPAFRYHQFPTASAPAIGFRCALNL